MGSQRSREVGPRGGRLREEELEDHLAQLRLRLEGGHEAVVQRAADGGLLRERAPDEAEDLELELQRVGAARAPSAAAAAAAAAAVLGRCLE
jgi:hypothetical protein